MVSDPLSWIDLPGALAPGSDLLVREAWWDK
jgi:hypothetical protein